MELHGFGFGIGTQNRKGEWLEVYYAQPQHKVPLKSVAALAEAVGYKGGNQAIEVRDKALLRKLGAPFDAYATAAKPVVATFLETNAPPTSVPDAYLKLHLLSHRLLRPHGTDLTGLFKVLPNVAWTSRGPVDLGELPALQAECRLRGEPLEITMVDKFPRMSDYVVPPGVRIADATRVRLGAYLGDGTTVMQEGFVNFNGGTEGPNMVEGRVSAGVFVGAGSDLGGGCSTMGTLSGGNNVVISIGKNCLLGANSGLGIPLGDDCTVEAGLYLTAASKVRVLDRERRVVKTMKASDLAGRSNLLFRRNSLDGAIECLPNKAAISLNDDLHANN